MASRPAGGNGAQSAASRSAAGARERRPATTSTITPGLAAETELVRVMLHDRSQVDFLLERLGAEDFLDPACREIFGALVSRGADAPVEELEQMLSALAVQRLEAALAEPPPGELAGRLVDDALRKLECRSIRLRSAEIDAMRLAGRGDADRLFDEKRVLAARAKELGCSQQYWK
jgi:hypothetical protein